MSDKAKPVKKKNRIGIRQSRKNRIGIGTVKKYLIRPNEIHIFINHLIFRIVESESESRNLRSYQIIIILVNKYYFILILDLGIQAKTGSGSATLVRGRICGAYALTILLILYVQEVFI